MATLPTYWASSWVFSVGCASGTRRRDDASMTAQTTLPPTSLILSTRNRPNMLTDLVASVLEGEDVPSEIVVVDQSSEPNPSLSNWFPKCGCELRYEWTQSLGVSRGRNEAIAAAQHDIIVITDDD